MCSASKNVDSESSAGTVVAWHIVLSLVSGIIIGILLCHIIWYSRHRWFRKRKPEQNPEGQTTEADTTYQEIDLSKMNTEYNYQSLRGNAAGDEDDSTYTDVIKTRDVEYNCQSLKGNAANNDAGDEEDSTYTDLNKIRDDKNTYQSLILI